MKKNRNLLTIFLVLIMQNAFLFVYPQQSISWPGGRYAITSDGNMHDPDDTGAIPMSIALMYYSGHKDKIVHLDHSNHIGGSLASKYNDMKESIAGIKRHFGLNDSIVFDCQLQLEAAKANFVKEALKSSAENPLWLVCAGPMGTAFEYLDAVAKADHPKLQFIHCISHSNANNTHNDTPELDGKTWEAMKAYFPQVNYHDIANQNKDNGFCSPIGKWSWMNQASSPQTWKWLYSRNRTASVHVGKFDMSDGGMTYWLLSGKVIGGVFKGIENGNWDGVKAIFADSIATGEGLVGTEPIPYKTYVPPKTEVPTTPLMPTGTLTPITPTDRNGVLLFQAEHSYSARGYWELISPGHPKYFTGASNDSMLIFTGNQPNLGPATSPLEYTFIAPENGTYQLIIRASRILDGAKNDQCNDFYVKMSGDFSAGANSFEKSILLKDTKHYFSSVPERTWGWTTLSETKINGATVKKKLFYVLKKDAVYTITISGRSQRAIMDYIILFNTSKVTTDQAKSAKPKVLASAFHNPAYRSLKVYPIPGSDILHIKSANQILECAIYNMKGAEIYRTNINSDAGIIDTSVLPGGNYILKCNDMDNNTMVRNIVIH